MDKITKYIIYLGLFLTFQQNADGQIGINLRYNRGSEMLETREQNTASYTNTFISGYELGFDYWKRLKNYRIEFFPEISLNFANDNLENNAEIDELNKFGVQFYLTTRIYPFDFSEDCDCPTFSKQGNWFTKGFFIFLSPGVSWTSYGGDPSEIPYNLVTWNAGAGLGVDIGINDLVTLSPMVSYRKYGDTDWQALADFINTSTMVYNRQSMQFNLRLGLRLDYGGARRFR